jgi:hypothetical protein
MRSAHANAGSFANVKTLAKLARALGVELSELAPPESLPSNYDYGDSFSAFCEDPFCESNKLKLVNNSPVVVWDSWQSYPMDKWGDLNFCRSCEGDLIKECSSCGMRLIDRGGRYCTRCGKELHSRPSEDDWKRINVQLKPGEGFDDDIPF